MKLWVARRRSSGERILTFLRSRTTTTVESKQVSGNRRSCLSLPLSLRMGQSSADIHTRLVLFFFFFYFPRRLPSRIIKTDVGVSFRVPVPHGLLCGRHLSLCLPEPFCKNWYFRALYAVLLPSPEEQRHVTAENLSHQPPRRWQASPLQARAKRPSSSGVQQLRGWGRSSPQRAASRAQARSPCAHARPAAQRRFQQRSPGAGVSGAPPQSPERWLGRCWTRKWWRSRESRRRQRRVGRRADWAGRGLTESIRLAGAAWGAGVAGPAFRAWASAQWWRWWWRQLLGQPQLSCAQRGERRGGWPWGLGFGAHPSRLSSQATTFGSSNRSSFPGQG